MKNIKIMKNKHSGKKHDSKDFNHNKNKHSNTSRNTRGGETMEGVIFVTMRGNGFVKVVNLKDDVEISEFNLNTALNKDIVKISLEPKRGNRAEGRVEEIIERAKTEFVGTITKKEGAMFFTPDDKKVYREIVIIPNRKSEQAKTNQKVLIKMEPWTNPKANPKGEIVKVLGDKGDNNVEMESIVYEKGFSPHFPKSIEDEAHRIKESAPSDFEEEVKKRLSAPDGPPSSWDFRNTTTFTIDPFDAKDFDDALSFKELPDGNYEVGIHIADVTHYVKEGSIIDKEAVKRGTSIYLVDRTIPMLPEVLSNDLCSLNPNEPRYAFSAVFVIDKEARVKEHWFGKTLIESDKRFTYEEAQEIIDKGTGIFVEELKTLNELAKKLRDERFRKGAIDFETEEVKFELNDLGKPIQVYRKERKDTHKLIEEFMLLANREVATHMHAANGKNSRAAFVYRIHDAPDREKIVNLATFVKALGFELKNKDGATTGEDIARMLRSVGGAPAEMLIKTAAVRAMSKAIYSTSNIGHFGLAFEYYTHFTSPIRRYPDLMVHRLLLRFLTKGQIEQDEIIKYQRLCSESSERELEAAQAERASIKYKQVEYMQEHIGEEFDAIVSGVSEWGIYVEELNTKAEGMVKLRDMKDDFYELNEKLYAIVGKNTSKKYSLGDKIRVKLIASDPERKTLDFQFI